jgi:histidinol-phosphate phosphatase family protein
VRPAVFLDRDGVLNELVVDRLSGVPESPLRVEEVRLMAGAATAVGRLAAEGYLLACVSNQPAAAKGRVSVVRLHQVHARVLELLAREGAQLDASYLCLHHVDGIVTGLARSCDCRKPAPGMLLDAAGALGIDLSHSWMVGDTDADIAAGKAAGCRTMLIRNPGSLHKRLQELSPDVAADSLLHGIDLMRVELKETIP